MTSNDNFIKIIITLANVLKSFKYRVYPTKTQEVLLRQHFHATRLVYNLALETKIAAYQSQRIHLSAYDLNNQLPELKKEYPWLCEVSSQALQAAIAHVGQAFVNFYNGNGYPKYKTKKHGYLSFSVLQRCRLCVETSRLSIPKFDGLKVKTDRPLRGEIKRVTISLSTSGQYHASILVETGRKPPKPARINTATAIGVDLGIKSLAVTSKGEKIENPLYLKRSLQKLQAAGRVLEGRVRGSAGHKKAQLRLAKLHQKVSNQRNDYLHKVSARLVRDNQTICLETLQVANMVKNRSLGRSIYDSGWCGLVRMIEYKSLWMGRNVLRIPRFAPSSKACNACGEENTEMTLKDRWWVCSCGAVHDRDINAAINIKKMAIENYNRLVCPVRPKGGERRAAGVSRPNNVPTRKSCVVTD